MILSEALKRARKLKSMSQAQCATAAGISTTQYQNYEYGKSEPSAGVLIRLALYLEVSLDYLVGVSDSPLQCNSELGAHRICFACKSIIEDDEAEYCQYCGHEINSNYCTNENCYLRNNDERIPCPETACYCPDCGAETEYLRAGLVSKKPRKV